MTPQMLEERLVDFAVISPLDRTLNIERLTSNIEVKRGKEGRRFD
jgi:hypothetical protein